METHFFEPKVTPPKKYEHLLLLVRYSADEYLWNYVTEGWYCGEDEWSDFFGDQISGDKKVLAWTFLPQIPDKFK